MGNEAKTTTVLLVGVGGQGTILAGDILAKTASASGYDVKISEIHGMSQRGGSVSTVVRFGDDVASMICDAGCADVIVSFEILEALRARPFLAKDGGKLLVNDEIIAPISVNTGQADMPSDIEESLGELGAVLVRAGDIARKANSPKSTNVVLLGALSVALPFPIETWRQVIAERVPPKTVEANLAAFDAGRKSVSEA